MMTYHQGEHDTVADHIRNIRNLLKIIEHYGESMLNEETLVKRAKKRDGDEGVYGKTDDYYKLEVRNKVLELRALKTTKRKAIIKDLRRKYLYKEDTYPKDLTEAHEMLNHYVVTNNISEGKSGARKQRTDGNERQNIIRGAQYAQEEATNENFVAGTDGKTHEVKCYEYGKMGHYAAQCPTKINDGKKSGTQETYHAEDVTVNSDTDSSDESVLITYYNHMTEENKYEDTAILLDTGSTVSVFKNRKMLTDIQETDVTMKALTNEGIKKRTTREFYRDSSQFGSTTSPE